MADNEAVERDDDQADAMGADSAEGKSRQREETEGAAGASDESGGDSGGEEQSDESRKAKEKEEEREQAKETMEKIEEDPPEKLEDWPDDAAKYETFGGPEGQHSYEDGPETKLGPSSLRHHEGGDVTIAGEEVDDPDQYKSDPIPGGPTDDDSNDLTAKRIRERQENTEPGEEEPGTDRSSGGSGDTGDDDDDS
jgi:hypothetical protein